MPCFDKKLEASRHDFALNDESGTVVKDVDKGLTIFDENFFDKFFF